MSTIKKRITDSLRTNPYTILRQITSSLIDIPQFENWVFTNDSWLIRVH